MLKAADEEGAVWVALGFDPNTGDAMFVPGDTLVLRVPVAPAEEIIPEPGDEPETVEGTASEVQS